MEQKKITFIGAGNMAKAIIAGLVRSGYPADHILVSSPTETRRLPMEQELGIRTTSDNLKAVQEADVVVLAVKPQLMADVCTPLQGIDFSNKLVISIAAGLPVSRINDIFATTLNLVRVMPNTPSLLGKGMSGLYATDAVCATDRDFTESLMKAVGEVCWVQQEAQINGIIAAAGSAPAYFFLFMEAMQNEALAQGFDRDTARLLVQQSALGAAEMVAANSQLSLAELRAQVTSKGGTTAEAINTFQSLNLEETVAKAMRAAVARAQEMETLF
ncbi:pyrroline-5-carboxylate reductase [Vibrio palustris]|uniref:Pyrroline-5-carboxylate reductase n=1 Tax=Vibrio palustris TaxID=1918946 RepID=A0A1R4B7P4_9VIBR|nr:pyrroline-5-carboxylate reductase [Vibrio palustris]SJL84940.1 Pyrroline-5-carboxylate reductase [Vibrio palustris]